MYSNLHSYTHAGILAGMRPCGIIVLVGELFMAESKTQVYGFLHHFFSRHPQVIEKLGMPSVYLVYWLVMVYLTIEIICYDDACHPQIQSTQTYLNRAKNLQQ